MAKTSSIEKNMHRQRLSKQFAARRQKLKDVIMDATLPMEERFTAQRSQTQS